MDCYAYQPRTYRFLTTVYDLPEKIKRWHSLPIKELRILVGDLDVQTRKMNKGELISELAQMHLFNHQVSNKDPEP